MPPPRKTLPETQGIHPLAPGDFLADGFDAALNAAAAELGTVLSTRLIGIKQVFLSIAPRRHIGHNQNWVADKITRQQDVVGFICLKSQTIPIYCIKVILSATQLK